MTIVVDPHLQFCLGAVRCLTTNPSRISKNIEEAENILYRKTKEIAQVQIAPTENQAMDLNVFT